MADEEGIKEKRDRLMLEAQKAAYDYAGECECPSNERSKAFEIYENLRNAGRVY